MSQEKMPFGEQIAIASTETEEFVQQMFARGVHPMVLRDYLVKAIMRDCVLSNPNRVPENKPLLQYDYEFLDYTASRFIAQATHYEKAVKKHLDWDVILGAPAIDLEKELDQVLSHDVIRDDREKEPHGS